MKKNQKRLSVARETLKTLQLDAKQLAEVAGGTIETNFSCGCPGSRIGCLSINESGCRACTWG